MIAFLVSGRRPGRPPAPGTAAAGSARALLDRREGLGSPGASCHAVAIGQELTRSPMPRQGPPTCSPPSIRPPLSDSTRRQAGKLTDAQRDEVVSDRRALTASPPRGRVASGRSRSHGPPPCDLEPPADEGTETVSPTRGYLAAAPRITLAIAESQASRAPEECRVARPWISRSPYASAYLSPLDGSGFTGPPET